MFELENFKYEFNEQNQVINGSKWRELYEKSNLTPIAHLVYQREMPILLLAKQYLKNIKLK